MLDVHHFLIIAVHEVDIDANHPLRLQVVERSLHEAGGGLGRRLACIAGDPAGGPRGDDEGKDRERAGAILRALYLNAWAAGSRKRSIELDQMLEGLLGGKPKRPASRPAAERRDRSTVGSELAGQTSFASVFQVRSPASKKSKRPYASTKATLRVGEAVGRSMRTSLIAIVLVVLLADWCQRVNFGFVHWLQLNVWGIVLLSFEGFSNC